LKRELLDKNLAFACQPIIAGQPEFKRNSMRKIYIHMFCSIDTSMTGLAKFGFNHLLGKIKNII
jgi:hypothetical protein